MLLTRSLRRKMVVGLALVMVMLLILAGAGISGLISYRTVVNDLDFSINKAPRGSELLAAIAELYKPLKSASRADVDGARFQQQEFQRAISTVAGRVLEFRGKLESMPPAIGHAQRKPIVEAFLRQVDEGLVRLRYYAEELGDSDRGQRKYAVQAILSEVSDLQVLASELPDPEDGLNETLDEARRVYRSRFWMLSVGAAVAVALFLGLIHCGYVWIFAPIRRLHRGALRVAQGDFDYRLELNSSDEMAELADSFNKMTARFQEIASELDWQVRQRSIQLVRSERLAGVGFLAAGVAHEINNPLSAIVMASDSLTQRFTAFAVDEDDINAQTIRKYLEMIQREAQRCRGITTRLLEFARGQQATRGNCDLATLIDEVIDMVQLMSKFRDRRIEFQHGERCQLQVNGAEIKQVVLNLVANALESMQSGGTLQITLTQQTDQVVLTFQDDGCGMSPEVIENLFEPFFTQKQDGKGTGLGLAISHRIISDHGGRIEASSDGTGTGSTFRVILPRCVESREAAA